LLLLLATGLFGGLGDFAGGRIFLDDGFDDSDGDSLPHVTDSEATEGRIVGERLHAHWLRWRQLDHSGVAGLDRLGEVFHLLAGTTIHFFLDLFEFAGNVSGMAIQDRRVSVLDLSRVVEDDDLSEEVLALLGWVVLRVGGNIATTDFFDGDVLDVEANVVTGKSLGKGLVVHFNRFDLSSDVSGSKRNDHTGLDDTSLDTTHGHCSNATDLVDILEWETEGFVGGARWFKDRVQSVDEGESSLVALGLGGLEPSLFSLLISISTGPPSHLLGFLQHVVSVPSRDGDEDNLLGVVSDLLDVSLDFLTDFQETGFAVGCAGGAVHLVDSDDQLLDAQSVGEKGMFAGLAILRDTSLELTVSGSDNEHGTISLGSASDHVLDEIPVTRGIDDGDVVVLGLELPQSDIDGDTTFTLSLEFVQNPGVFERALTHLLGLLLELLDDTFVDTTAFVDKMASGGGLAGVYVSNDDDVDMNLLFTHFEESQLRYDLKV